MGTDNERNLNIAAVRAAIEGGLRNLERDPERGVRNMLDLGKYFSRTHRQRSFFQMAQRMLGRKRSQYMQLVKRTVTDVDHDTLKTLGINMGYYSWSQGAKVIREIEATRGFNVPWSLTISLLDSGDGCLNLNELRDIIDQAHALGIHCYWVAANQSSGDIFDMFNLFGTYKDCAFFMLLPVGMITSELAENALKQHNIAVCVRDTADLDVRAAAEILHEMRLLFGLYYMYDDANADEITSGHVQSDVDNYRGQFALFIPSATCMDECRAKVQAYASGEKVTPEKPPFMVDFYADLAAVDAIISSQSCYIEIDAHGNVASAPWTQPCGVNIRTHTLADALLKLAPRKAE